MTGEHQPFAPVTTPIRRLLGEHPNMEGLLDTVEQDPKPLMLLLWAFDGVIKDYNRLNTNNLSEDLVHMPHAKAASKELPSTYNLIFKSDADTFYSFARVLQTMSPLMDRAEQQLEEPNIGFHVWEDATTEERLVGGILQTYGLTVARIALGHDAPEAEQYALKDTLLDALIEVMAISPRQNSPVLAVAKKQGWFEAKNQDGTYLFTEKVRELAE